MWPVRELVEADLGLIRQGTSAAAGLQPLQRIRERHHALARILAGGATEPEASAITGYTVVRVQQLKQDPAFQDLLAMYSAQADLAFANVVERMSALALDAVDEIHTRLEDAPEEFELGDLVDVVKLTADRSGAGPVARSVNLNVNVGMAERMRAARERVEAQRSSALEAQQSSGPASLEDPKDGTSKG